MNTTELFETVGTLCAPRRQPVLMVQVCATPELLRALRAYTQGGCVHSDDRNELESLRIQLECARIQQERAGRVAS